VLKQRQRVHIRSSFSRTQDVVIRVGTGPNNQINFDRSWFVPADTPTDVFPYRREALFHGCSDDAAPWKFNGTYIGGNHGCSDALEVTAAKHGLSTRDIGSAWLDAAETTFHIIKIVDPDRIWFLSQNKGGAGLWKFTVKITGPVLTATNGRTLKVEKTVRAQIHPACRIIRQAYLVNGDRPLVDGQATSCEYLDIVDEHEIIRPDSLLAAILKHPGREPDYVAAGLEPIIHNRIVYRFQPRGVCTIRHKAKAYCDFDLGYMGFTQSSRLARHLGGFDCRESYIPKTIPFEMNGDRLDFRRVQDITPDRGTHRPLIGRIAGNIADPLNPPDRFVQFLGRKRDGRNSREVGYAIGYSLLEGVTKPETRAGIGLAFRMIESRKSYPVAVYATKIRAGAELECLAYRQYFDPTRFENATCVYWHRQGGACVLYADYHKSVAADVIPLPAELVGRKVTVLEKTPSATLLSGGTIAATGITVSVTSDYGYLVLKLGASQGRLK